MSLFISTVTAEDTESLNSTDNTNLYDEIELQTDNSNKYEYSNSEIENTSEYSNNNKNNEITENYNTNSEKTVNLNSNSYSYNGILSGANRTSNFIKENNRLPAVVEIDNKNVNMNDFLYLLCKSLNSTSTVTVDQYSHVTSNTGTNCNNQKIYQEEYLILSNEIIKCYTINKRNPLKISTVKLNTMSFDDTVYFYARAVAWKYNNNRLPNYGTVIALHNNDYSGDENALICNSNNPFTINTTCEKRDNETYKLTLNPSEQCTIYYTRNGTTPTKRK
ncbi:hypothetical protein [uncultured Methanosphaera sp.]|uniref:hypothetical protein n=1 Tax=uncultured Methanosphaera sp. TaxID=262501 RepID=UPI00280A935F|nr:hypothetical protein [uncultured Methanosphaera sp.]